LDYFSNSIGIKELLPPVVKHIFIPAPAMSYKSLPRFPRKNFKAAP
jgi:hypothetical protein